MTPDEHEAQRRMVWIEAMRKSLEEPWDSNAAIFDVADMALDRFDARFPAQIAKELGVEPT